jgi:hypothetical protein
VSKSTRDDVLETVRSLLNAPGGHTIPSTIRLRLHFDELCRHIDTLKERVAVLEARADRPAGPKLSTLASGECATCGVPANVPCAHEFPMQGGDDGK